MKNKIFLRLSLVITLIMIAVCVEGAFASWHYYLNPSTEANTTMTPNASIFEYKPDEVLPGDQQATELHQNHLNLINSIVDHDNYGLNASDKSKPIVRLLLESGAGIVYGNQNVQGGNLKHMLVGGSDVNRLMFVAEYETDTKYNSYTFLEADAKSSNVDRYITVYKTVIIKNGNRWEATTSYYGKAKVFEPGVVSYSIDVTTWEYVSQASIT